jgi:hypothetical protein
VITPVEAFKERSAGSEGATMNNVGVPPETVGAFAAIAAFCR